MLLPKEQGFMYTIDDIAQMYRVSSQTIKSLVKRGEFGKIEPTYFWKNVKITKDALIDFDNRHKIAAISPSINISVVIQAKRTLCDADVSGIYCITCKPLQKIYVGSSANIAQRWYTIVHGSSNKYIHEAILFFKLIDFKFEILELTTPVNLTQRETAWITQLDACNPYKGFNFKSIGARSFTTETKPASKVALDLFGDVIRSEVKRLTT